MPTDHVVDTIRSPGCPWRLVGTILSYVVLETVAVEPTVIVNGDPNPWVGFRASAVTDRHSDRGRIRNTCVPITIVANIGRGVAGSV